MAITVNYGNGTSGALGAPAAQHWTAADQAPATYDWSGIDTGPLPNYDQNLNDMYRPRPALPSPQKKTLLDRLSNKPDVPYATYEEALRNNNSPDFSMAGFSQLEEYRRDAKKYPRKALDPNSINYADTNKDAVVDYLHQSYYDRTPPPVQTYKARPGDLSSYWQQGKVIPRAAYDPSTATPFYHLGDDVGNPIYEEAATKFGMTPAEVKALYGNWYEGYSTLRDPVKADWQNVRASGEDTYGSVLSGIRKYQNTGLESKYAAANTGLLNQLYSMTPESIQASDTYLAPEYYALHLPGMAKGSKPYMTTTPSDFDSPEEYRRFMSQMSVQDRETGGPFNIATEFRQGGGKKPEGYRWDGTNEMGYGNYTDRFNLAQNYLSDQTGKSALDAGYDPERAVKGMFKKKKESGLGGALGIIGAVSMFVPGLQPLAIAANAANAVLQASNGNWLGAALSAFGAAKAGGAFNDMFGSIGGTGDALSSSVGNAATQIPNTGVGAFIEGGASSAGAGASSALSGAGNLFTSVPNVNLVSEFTGGSSLGGAIGLANSTRIPDSLSADYFSTPTASSTPIEGYTGGSSTAKMDFTTGDYAAPIATEVPKDSIVDALTEETELEKLKRLATSDIGKAVLKNGAAALMDKLKGNSSGNAGAEAGANELPAGAFGEVAKPLTDRTIPGLGVADSALETPDEARKPNTNNSRTTAPRKKLKYMTAGKAKKEVK
jgi:hypothetical protein